LADPTKAARYQITASTDLAPFPLAAMNPARSHETPQLQVADTLAGACTEVLRADARGETPSAWVQRLREIGVLSCVGHSVSREPAASAPDGPDGERVAAD
jgi:hypothetical protein